MKKGKDVDALICHGSTLQVALNLNQRDITIIN